MNEQIQVRIEDIVVGSGITAIKGALCFVHYDGYLDDGTCFDSTKKHGRAFEFVVGSKKVIVGWSHGVLGMKEGGKRKIHIPSQLAYGDRQVGQFIKPNSNLTFDVEMLEVRPREE
ncbi:MAG: FKBP-type peptidyl-prolyl cis-trans isomerase [Pseudobdellovibrio sp.]